MIKELRMKPYVALFICLFSLSVAAQQPAPPKAPQGPAAPAAPAPPASPASPAPPAPPADPEQGGQPINIRLDVSVIDQTAQGATQPKSLMVMLVDRANARPVLVDGRIRVYVTLQSEASRSFGPPKETEDHTINWRNSFSLLLENGKPMLALETMDAVTKRKMSIEVKATIQK
jgi:hypothetical protein